MKSFKIFLSPVLASVLATTSLASQPEEPSLARLNKFIDATDKEFWQYSSSNQWQQSSYLYGWHWDKFSEQLNIHAPESVRAVLKGKHKRSALSKLAMDQTQSLELRMFSSLLFLNHVRDYIRAKEKILKPEEGPIPAEDKERFYAQENIVKRLSEANSVKALLSDLMLDANLPNKDLSKRGIDRHRDMKSKWVASSALFLDGLGETLQAEQVYRWWQRVVQCGELSRWTFFLSHYKQILKHLEPKLRAPFARAMLNDPEQSLTDTEIEDYAYYLYLDDKQEGLLSRESATRLSVMNSRNLNRPHDCYFALHLARSLADVRSPKFIADLVERALSSYGYDQRDELAAHALRHFAPLYLSSIGKTPTAEQMKPVQSWMALFDQDRNKNPAVQEAIASFSQTYKFPQAFLRYLALNDYMSEDGPAGVENYLPVGHPALEVMSLPTRLERCEFLLALVKDEPDPEVAYLLTRWGLAIAHVAKNDSEEYQSYSFDAKRLREKQLQVQWGDDEHSDDDWFRRDKENAKSLPELEILIKAHERLQARIKDLTKMLLIEAADAAAKVALGDHCDYGDRDTVLAKWAERAALAYSQAYDAQGLTRVWSLAKASFEGPYLNRKEGGYHSFFEFRNYEDCIGLLCGAQLRQLVAGSKDIGSLDYSFLPEKHFLREALLEKDAAQRIALVKTGLEGKQTLANLYGVIYLADAMILQAAKRIHETEKTAESKKKVLDMYLSIFSTDANRFSFLDSTKETAFVLYTLKDFRTFTQGETLDSHSPELVSALRTLCQRELAKEQSLLFKLFEPAEIQFLRDMCAPAAITGQLSGGYYSMYGFEAAFPIGHPVHDVMDMKAHSVVEPVGELVQAKKLFELSCAEPDASRRLILLWKAKELWNEMYKGLHYEERDSILNNAPFLETVVFMEVLLQTMLKPREVKELWLDLFEPESVVSEKQQQQEQRIGSLKSQIKSVHGKTKSLLSRSAAYVPEAAALKEAYQAVMQGSPREYSYEERRWLSDVETFARKPYTQYTTAVRQFCEFIWGLRDNINRAILALSMERSSTASSQEQVLWQLHSVMFANELLKKSPLPSELKALPEQISELNKKNPEITITAENALFMLGVSPKQPMVLDDALLGRLTDIWRSLLAYTKTNKLPESLGKKLMESMPKDIAQVGGRFLESRVEPHGCVAYFTMQMYLKRLTSMIIDNQSGVLPEEDLMAILTDYNATTMSAIAAFYREPSRDWLHRVLNSYDTSGGASNVVALRIADQAWHLLDEVRDVLIAKAQTVPTALETQLQLLRDKVITIADQIDFGQMGGDDNKYFKGHSFLKVISMFEDPISRCYFLDKTMQHLSEATYEGFQLPDVDRCVRSFDLHQNIKSYKEWQQRLHTNYAKAVLVTCQKKLESKEESALFAAADYKQLALAMDKDVALPGDNARLAVLEAEFGSHVEKTLQQIGDMDFAALARVKQSYLGMQDETLASHPYASKLKGAELPGTRALLNILGAISKREKSLEGK